VIYLNHRQKILAFILAGCLALSACSDDASAIISKSRNARTTTQLVDAIGRPDQVIREGALRRWIYETKDGQVIFLVQGAKVSFAGIKLN